MVLLCDVQGEYNPAFMFIRHSTSQKWDSPVQYKRASMAGSIPFLQDPSN